jgi:hypothetical protein
MKLRFIIPVALAVLIALSGLSFLLFFGRTEKQESVQEVFEANLKEATLGLLKDFNGSVSSDDFRFVELLEFNRKPFRLVEGWTGVGKLFYKFYNDVREPNIDCTAYSGEAAIMCLFVKYNYGYNNVRMNMSTVYANQEEQSRAVEFLMALPRSTYREIAFSGTLLKFLFGRQGGGNMLYDLSFITLCEEFSEKYAREGADGLCGVHFAASLLKECYKDNSLFAKVADFYPVNTDEFFCYYTAYTQYLQSNEAFGSKEEITAFWTEDRLPWWTYETG